MATHAPELRFTRPTGAVAPDPPSGELPATGRYRRALELAVEIERLLEAEAPPSSRLGYSSRIAQAMNRSLIDQLSEIVRDGAA
jgi:hypothetical protein